MCFWNVNIFIADEIRPVEIRLRAERFVRVGSCVDSAQKWIHFPHLKAVGMMLVTSFPWVLWTIKRFGFILILPYVTSWDLNGTNFNFSSGSRRFFYAVFKPTATMKSYLWIPQRVFQQLLVSSIQLVITLYSVILKNVDTCVCVCLCVWIQAWARWRERLNIS